MQIKHKILALGVLPLALSVLVISILIIFFNKQLADQQAELVEESILASKRSELKNHLSLALSSISPLYNNSDGGETSKQKVLDELRRLSFGVDGYFFVYDSSGKNLMHARQAELEGRQLYKMTDPNGLAVIQALLKAAESGDGFQRYAWNKPSTGRITDKLSYVVKLPEWGWILGTGIYLEDVRTVTLKTRKDILSGVQKTMAAVVMVALIALLVVFAGGMTLNVSAHRLADRKLKKLTKRLVYLQEEERARVSRELHDGVSQLLVSIKYQFELACYLIRTDEERATAVLKEGIERLGATIGEVRIISHDLRSSLLDNLGLPSALSQLSDEVAQRSGLQVEYFSDCDGRSFESSAAISLFRIVQEALANIELHANAKAVMVSLRESAGWVYLVVQDDGEGFNVEKVMQEQSGIGLKNIQERVDNLNGEFGIFSSASGTIMTVRISLEVCPR